MRTPSMAPAAAACVSLILPAPISPMWTSAAINRSPVPVPQSPVPSPQSEQQLQRELDVPRKIILGRHLPEVHVRRVGVGVGEHRIVERVQELGMELRAD